LTTELVSIAGVGEKTATKLLQHFGSVAALKQKTVDEIAAIVGHRTAQAIYSYFHSSPNNAELTIEEL
jgi:excinuclease ABC subunit C